MWLVAVPSRVQLRSAEEGTTITVEEPTTRVTPMRILVVEDNDDGRKMLSLLLELQGHETREASDGMAAIDLALKWRPDAALVDIGLPRMDGYQVARRLRNEFGSRITLIAQTSYGEPEDRALAMAAGFDVHLTKPVDPRELSDHLQIASQRLAGNVRRER